MIRVTVWNEYKHEREYEGVRKVYPQGIHGCIASFLEKQEDIQVRTATFDMPEHGLTEEVLADTDVLIFWSHALQDAFSDEVASGHFHDLKMEARRTGKSLVSCTHSPHSGGYSGENFPARRRNVRGIF